MRKIVLRFGLIAGAMLSVVMVVALQFHDAIGFDKALWVGYTSMVVAFLMVYFGIRSYRDEVGGGQISFGRAFAVGGMIVLLASLCYVATWEVIYFGTHSDYIEKYAAHAIEQARAGGASEAELAAQAQQMADFSVKYHNPFFNVAVTLLEPLPVGLIITLVSAGLLSRRRNRQGAGSAQATAALG